jgi:two-component sensor histidine kinase
MTNSRMDTMARPSVAAILPGIFIEQAPMPMASLAGPRHIVRSVNPSLCRLLDVRKDDAIGKPFHDLVREAGACRDLLDRVYRSGKPESRTSQQRSDAAAPFPSYAVWPVMAEGRALGLVIQIFETLALRDKILAVNEALTLGALRQHVLTAEADASNIALQREIGARMQREADALMLTKEVAHRIKNNLQIVVSLMAFDARDAPADCAVGYKATQDRIRAISELYDLISQSDSNLTVSVDGYLRKIAKIMLTSLLESTSQIGIEVDAEPLDIESERAVPLGLLVNELVTNAIKHAFPDRVGRVVLSARQVDDQIELTVADNGMGMTDATPRSQSEKHGSDYVTVFVRQLGGTIDTHQSAQGGTVINVRIPHRLSASSG